MEHTSGIGVLDKAVRILRQASLAPVTLNELVERLELPKATAHRIAIALEEHGLLRRNDGGTWVPGPLLAAAFSPDGQSIACIHRDEQPNSPLKVAIFRLGGEEPPKVFDGSKPDPKIVRWRPDGKALTYIATSNGISNIWSQPLDGGEPAELTNFRSDQTFWWFDRSRDGQWFVSARGTENNDIILISNFK